MIAAKWLVFLTLILMFAVPVIEARKIENEIIPRKDLFGYSSCLDPQVSPDGAKLAYLAPSNNSMNLWIRTMSGADDRPLTQDRDLGIWFFRWSYDNRHILYLKDNKGDENYQLFGVDCENGIIINYTPIPNVSVLLYEPSPNRPNHILLGINRDDPRFHDVYILDLKTQKLTPLEKNPGDVMGFVSDSLFNVLVEWKNQSNGGSTIHTRVAPDQSWSLAGEFSPEDTISSTPLSLSADGKKLYLRDSTISDTICLTEIDIENHKKTVVASDPYYDIGRTVFEKATGNVIAVEVLKDRTTWIVVDADYKKDFEILTAVNKGNISIINQSSDESLWTIGYSTDIQPTVYYIYDRKAQILIETFRTYPEVEKHKLAPVLPFEFQARDGLTLHGYIAFPLNSKPTNLPLVLKVHGGPYLRDYWGYDSEIQWLTNRGFACMMVNYRGSTGYGKAFLAAAKKEWGGKMQDDLIDAVKWAIEKGYADSNKVAIYGASYGGYAALVGATFTPDIFCCAIDVMGPSNLHTFLQTVPSYWESSKYLFDSFIGDPETEKEFLELRSPLFKVDDIQIPVMIVQGVNDPRVRQAESEQIIASMRKKSLRYKYIIFPDEGHQILKHANKMKLYSALERFLAANLGGRAEKEVVD